MDDKINAQKMGSSRWVKRLGWTLGGVAGLWAVGWLAVPPILKSQAQKIASEQLGRQVTLGHVDFKPWTLELTVDDLAIAGLPGTGDKPQLAVKRIYIDAELQSLLRLAPVLDAITVDGPSARLTHLGGGKYDVDDILARLAQASAAKPQDPSAAAPQFALFNIALNGGSLDFTDQSVNKTHELRELRIGLPFLSNLDSRRDVRTEPRLAFKFNGSSFDSAAQATPFAQTHKADATLKLTGLDLTPYLGYIPTSLPVQLQAAVVNADLKLAFEQITRPALKLSGVVEVIGAKLADTQSKDLLAFESLKVSLGDVRPLEQVINLSEVELSGPTVNVTRDKAGKLNWLLQDNTQSKAKNAPEKIAEKPDSTRASGTKDTDPKSASPATPASPWQVAVGKFGVHKATVQWSDSTTQPQAQLALHDVSLEATQIAWPIAQPVPFQGGATVGDAATLRFSGSATDQAATLTASLGDLPLALASPYTAVFLAPHLTGSLSAELGVQWKAPDLQLSAKKLTLKDLALLSSSGMGGGAKSKAALASIKQLEVSDAQVDLARQTVTVGKLAIVAPKVAVQRSADQQWMFERWLKASPEAGPSAAAKPMLAKSGTVKASEPVWKVAMTEATLDGGAVSYEDNGTAKPVSFEVSALKLALKNFALDGKKPALLNVSARIKSAQSEPGSLDYKGSLGLSPLLVQGKLVATQIPVHAFEPYFGDALNIELLRADAGFKGDLRYAESANGPQIKLGGDVLLEDFRANSAVASVKGGNAGNGGAAGAAVARPSGMPVAEELLTWKALSLRGLDVAVAPGTATRVEVKETALTDFFARVIINETGRINLQDLVKSSAQSANEAAPGPAAGASATVSAAPASAPAAINKIANNAMDTGSGGQNKSANALDPVINIGPVSLINGKVYFSDRFVKPNYSANLSDLTGRLSAFSSTPEQGVVQLADLELRGRAEGTASLDISGKLNPLAKPLALDIKGKVRDLELPPLSPYSVKYAGHGIERGKMSVDVAYLVKPDGQLTASNNIVLNQLSFGEAVPGAPNSLPVKLAVALLADRNGVIDINLPISGSLNDPQFSLGPIIFKVIINLVVKAITSPFSLLASAFGGGGDELSMVAFAPGSAVLAEPAKGGLDKVAKALTDRPSLKMTVTGTASLDEERDAYRRERLKGLLLAEKRRAAVASNGGNAAAAVVSVSDAEAPALLKEVYKRADISKPRNLVGMAKDLPGPEMESLLLTNIPVNEDVMRELALQRGVAVKDYLAGKNLPVERLFLGAVKPAGATSASPAAGAVPGAGAPAAAALPAAKWTPRAELNLATN